MKMKFFTQQLFYSAIFLFCSFYSLATDNYSTACVIDGVMVKEISPNTDGSYQLTIDVFFSVNQSTNIFVTVTRDNQQIANDMKMVNMPQNVTQFIMTINDCIGASDVQVDVTDDCFAGSPVVSTTYAESHCACSITDLLVNQVGNPASDNSYVVDLTVSGNFAANTELTLEAVRFGSVLLTENHIINVEGVQSIDIQITIPQCVAPSSINVNATLDCDPTLVVTESFEEPCGDVPPRCIIEDLTILAITCTADRTYRLDFEVTYLIEEFTTLFYEINRGAEVFGSSTFIEGSSAPRTTTFSIENIPSIGATDVLLHAFADCPSPEYLNNEKYYDEFSCIEATVWPGDVNNDGLVNFDDAVSLGRKEGLSHVARINASTEWVGQNTYVWDNTQPDLIDAVYADCDGNGIIDNSVDQEAIALNYGLDNGTGGVHNRINDFTGDAILIASWDNIETEPSASTIEIGLNLDHLNSETMDIHGIRFSVDYSDLGASAMVKSINSVLGNTQELSVFSTSVSNGKMDIALVRTVGSNQAINSGTICNLEFVLDAASSTDKLDLKIYDVRATTLDGNESVAVQGSTASVLIASGNRSPLLAPTALLLTGTLSSTCNGVGTGKAYPFGGTPPYIYRWEDNTLDDTNTNLSVGENDILITDATLGIMESSILIEGNCGGNIPLELLSFTAQSEEEKVLLKWTTTNEIGIEKIIVERSSDGQHFTPINEQAPQNQVLNHYFFTDKSLKNQQLYYYRLRTVELTNKSNLSSTIVVQLKEINTTNVHVFPNPVTETLQINFEQPIMATATIKLLNASGQLIRQNKILVNKDTSQLNLKGLSKGLYFVQIMEHGKTRTFKVIKE